MPRIASCLIAVLLCAGCAAAPRSEPAAAALVIAFADDFHSGLILERSSFPAGLLSTEAPGAGQAPWVAVHFGERRWMSGEADGVLDALRLGLGSGEGGVQVDPIPWWLHDRGGTVPAEERVWVFPLSEERHAALIRALPAWIAPDATVHRLGAGGCWWPSSHPWKLTGNCHDFTADLLLEAGIPLEWTAVRQARGMRAALDAAWMAHHGVAGQGPP